MKFNINKIFSRFYRVSTKSNLVLTPELNEILIGLILGDVCSVKNSDNHNTHLKFEQGFLHKDYLFHLYELFSNYCLSAPKITNRKADLRTGNIYTRGTFHTCSLPCFNELHNLFYSEGKKIIPSNIGELLTSLSLCYWICDDGSWDKTYKRVVLATNSFSLEEVNLLVDTLTDKFKLECYPNKQSTGHVIIIKSKSIPDLQKILEPIMPQMMLYKLGL